MKNFKIMLNIFAMTLLFAVAVLVSSSNFLCASGINFGDGEAIISKIMPYATSVSSGLILVIIAIIPTAKKLLYITKKLESSNRNLQETLAENELLKTELSNIHNELTQIKKTNERIRKMTELGFCNIRELVEGGFARVIAEAGEAGDEE